MKEGRMRKKRGSSVFERSTDRPALALGDQEQAMNSGAASLIPSLKSIIDRHLL